MGDRVVAAMRWEGRRLTNTKVLRPRLEEWVLGLFGVLLGTRSGGGFLASTGLLGGLVIERVRISRIFSKRSRRERRRIGSSVLSSKRIKPSVRVE